MSGWPTKPEIEQACRHLWTGDHSQQFATVAAVLAEIQNIRRQQ